MGGLGCACSARDRRRLRSSRSGKGPHTARVGVAVGPSATGHRSVYGEYPSDRTRLGHEWLLAVTRHMEVDLVRWIWAFIDRPLERFDQAAAFRANVTDSRLSTRRGSDGEFVTLLPRSGHPSLKVQGVQARAERILTWKSTTSRLPSTLPVAWVRRWSPRTRTGRSCGRPAGSCSV